MLHIYVLCIFMCMSVRYPYIMLHSSTFSSSPSSGSSSANSSTSNSAGSGSGASKLGSVPGSPSDPGEICIKGEYLPHNCFIKFLKMWIIYFFISCFKYNLIKYLNAIFEFPGPSTSCGTARLDQWFQRALNTSRLIRNLLNDKSSEGTDVLLASDCYEISAQFTTVINDNV